MAVNCACLSLGGCCSPFSFSPDHYLASIIDVIMPERREEEEENREHTSNHYPFGVGKTSSGGEGEKFVKESSVASHRHQELIYLGAFSLFALLEEW